MICCPDRIVEGSVDLSLRQFLALVVLLGAVYGFFMGWFGVIGNEQPRYEQLLASTVKIPALFLLTLVVTFPSLYVFNALIGCRLTFPATLRLLVGAIAVNLAVAASFGPILGFFTLSTESYSFMILLNVALLAIAGFVGLGFLLQTLRRLAFVSSPPAPSAHEPPEPSGSETPAAEAFSADNPSNPDNPGEEGSDAEPPSSPPRALPTKALTRSEHGPMERVSMAMSDSALGQSNLTFKIWLVIYGLVGAQMGWILRPFIGNPGQDFEWFRKRQGSFFEAVLHHLQSLITG